MPFEWPLKFHVKIGSGYQIIKKISLENGLTKLHGVLSNTLTSNKTHTIILVCAADDFWNFAKVGKLSIFKNS